MSAKTTLTWKPAAFHARDTGSRARDDAYCIRLTT
jgi:hypothetical protein